MNATLRIKHVNLRCTHTNHRALQSSMECLMAIKTMLHRILLNGGYLLIVKFKNLAKYALLEIETIQYHRNKSYSFHAY